MILLSAQRIYNSNIIQLGFSNDTDGAYSIGLKEIAGISGAILEDTKENTFTDLSKGAYSFAWETTDEESRFVLHLNVVGIEDNPQDSHIRIFAADNQIFIKGAETGQVWVSDIAGRILLQQEINGNDPVSIPANCKTGIYLVTVQNGQEVQTEKVLIR